MESYGLSRSLQIKDQWSFIWRLLEVYLTWWLESNVLFVKSNRFSDILMTSCPTVIYHHKKNKTKKTQAVDVTSLSEPVNGTQMAEVRFQFLIHCWCCRLHRQQLPDPVEEDA